ncbi:MAG: hypothetical protein K8S13_21365 [Desulfobacula sp.]|uniref:TolB family protein n=1 Tax=Desulfobacula sp. TaxID=2593537 RepID=UPI0025C08B08|nr:hypothetical protein [Desulfobacula sp.]MCD4722383.1 hypothetical protein [Desulfobacula sp.]
MLPVNICIAKGMSSNQIGCSCLTDEFWQIWKFNLDTRQSEQLTFDSQDKKEPKWYQKGRKFLYRTSNARIYSVLDENNDGKKILEKYGNLFDPDISPDSQEMVFTRFKEDLMDDSDIWKYNFLTRTIQKLTDMPGRQYDPVWSPDGGKIAYVSAVKNKKKYGVWVMDKSGENKACVIETRYNNMKPCWSHDGRYIAYTSDAEGNSDIWVLDLTNNQKKRLTRFQGLDAQPVWSENDQTIFFVSTRQETLQIWQMKANGSDKKPVTPMNKKCTDPVWINTK